MALVRRVGRRLASGGKTTTAAALGVGTVAALFNQDMGTYSMDYIEDALTGSTNVDEVYTGAQRSITSPLSFQLARGAAGFFGRGLHVGSFPIIPGSPIGMPPPVGFMSGASSAYTKAMPGRDDYMNGSMSSEALHMRRQQTSRTPNQAIDGSMVFGMYNLRR